MINAQTDTEIDRAFGLYQTEKRSIDADRKTELEAAASEEEAASINETYDRKQEAAAQAFKEKMNETVNTMMEESGKTAVRDIETTINEGKKRTIEDSIKDHLRGFSRTIPSFLMAYGDDDTLFRHSTSSSLTRYFMMLPALRRTISGSFGMAAIIRTPRLARRNTLTATCSTRSSLTTLSRNSWD